MEIILSIILYVVCVGLGIFDFAAAAYYFNKKEYGWFGYYAVMAIYWVAWIICHSFG